MSMIKDITLLVARLAIGLAFVAHGWDKFSNGIGNVATGFDAMGVPLPEVSAWVTAVGELVGGAALVLGVGLPVAGVVLAALMAGAAFFVHIGNGFFASEGGVELVLVLGTAALALGFNGGSYAVDRLLFRGTPPVAAAGTSGQPKPTAEVNA
ncbi:DoxX family protein [Actinoalloteichus sp. AHMU CJ021]|uniref:Oxidoreductase n=1 Tax=Actinoalloteichus caeruleus DSM 43889 TaxID=1120930 RepID=A0ABT1JMD1_ACTCY|nr:DoxX family protein [Actinoalloteichus caeruleus]AUS79380.1 DoxX family protein [Actinoalloteichus sp. AHMU CJ021]MCP2333681.1 putative oxidoreductase [Actinoalloteichus caeruleus DSM 43889]